MFIFKNDYGQVINFVGSRYDMIRVVDAVKETEFARGCAGLLGIDLIDLYIESKNNEFFIKVLGRISR